MMHRTILLTSVAALAVAGGCYTGGSIDSGLGNRAQPSSAVDGTEPTDDASITGVPCEVASVLATRCATCHGQPLSGGAPNRLVSYEDLTAPSRSDPALSMAELSVVRMKAAKAPMPPEGAAASDIAVLEGWIAAGMPNGACSSPLDGVDASVQESSTHDPPSVCTSNTRWTRGDHGSAAMHPGAACIACHSAARGPRYTAAGTLYPTAHEPDDCNGSKAGATVVITDANGRTYPMPVNAAGNFFTSSSIAAPYRAKVVLGSKTREMKAPQTDGDCNGCHSATGSQKALGRVMAP
jgi:hypothetical protein